MLMLGAFRIFNADWFLISFSNLFYDKKKGKFHIHDMSLGKKSKILKLCSHTVSLHLISVLISLLSIVIFSHLKPQLRIIFIIDHLQVKVSIDCLVNQIIKRCLHCSCFFQFKILSLLEMFRYDTNDWDQCRPSFFFMDWYLLSLLNSTSYCPPQHPRAAAGQAVPNYVNSLSSLMAGQN